MLVVAAMTAAGGGLRLWSVGRLGLVHFDEGIYAMAGTWVLSPGGLGAIDPTVISYAPPGFPFLIGLAYGLLGVGDVPAILVSVLAGTLTIPAVGWLSCRTFGRGAGAAASAFAAFSGPHIAFSRMALTDASFLVTWLVAVGLGQAFLERPGPLRAAGFGVAVGAAQLLKYNGWLAGLIVALGALSGPLVDRGEWAARKQAALWGWGGLAAILAAIVYWPWYRFVENHGGYAALLSHHRGYLGGLSSWPWHAMLQVEQDRALSGGIGWMAFGGLAAALAMLIVRGAARRAGRAAAARPLIAISLVALSSFFQGPVFGAVLAIVVLAVARAGMPTRPVVVIAIGWLVLSLLTPFYHPYARLLLPLGALAWVLLGGAFSMLGRGLEGLAEADPHRIVGMSRALLGFAAGCGLVPLVLVAMPWGRLSGGSIVELLEPSDSVRTACGSIAGALVEAPPSLRLFGRPPLTFYLSGAVRVAPQATLDAVLRPRDAGAWALVDAAMVRQGGGLGGRLGGADDRWDLVAEVPTRLNWPTLLDLDPSAATGGRPDRSAPLFLFRPKPPGAPR